MKYLPLVWAGLWRTPVRTVLMLLSVAATFVLFGCLYGVNAGFNSVIQQIPANRLHVTSINLDRALPDHYKEKIEQLPGVASVMISTEISAYYREPQNLLYIAAVGGEAHLDVFGDISDAQRHTNALRAMRTGAVIGRTLAESFGWRAGNNIFEEISGWCGHPVDAGPRIALIEAIASSVDCVPSSARMRFCRQQTTFFSTRCETNGRAVPCGRACPSRLSLRVVVWR